MMLGVVGIMTFLALWWQFSQKRSASGMLEPARSLSSGGSLSRPTSQFFCWFLPIHADILA